MDRTIRPRSRRSPCRRSSALRPRTCRSLRWLPLVPFRLVRALSKTRKQGRFFPLATIARMFTPLPDKPDHPALELEILDVWERESTFEQLRERNDGGPAWSFAGGPVTANKTLPVNTAWGRTLKDVFQRYKALRGFDQR